MLVAQANSGFLLTRQQQDTAQGIRFTYWVHTAQGPQSLLVEQQNQVFFIASADEAQVRSLLQDLKGWHLADVALKDLQQQSVLALYCNSLALARQIIARLSEADVLLMEEDIRAVDRYLMERFIQGGVR